MSSICIDHMPCKDCGSGDNLAVYLNVDNMLGVEWYTSFCYGKCYEQKGDPYSETNAEPPKAVVRNTKADLARELAEVKECRVYLPVKYRGIPRKIYKSWKLRLMLSEYNGKSPYAIAFPLSRDQELVGFKCRPFKKKTFFARGDTKDTDPFGLVRALRIKSNVLWITEGEFDALALDYCLSEVSQCADQFPVISLTHGGGSIRKNLNRIDKYLDRYGQIRLVLDDDEVGHKAERTALEMYGNKIKIIKKPEGCKDANDAVLNGKTWSMGVLALYANE